MDEEQDEMTVTNEPALIPLVAAGKGDGVHHFKHGWIPLDGVALRTPKGPDARPGRMDVYVDGEVAGSIEKRTRTGSQIRGRVGNTSVGRTPDRTEWRAHLPGQLSTDAQSFKSRKEAAAYVTAEHKAAKGSSPLTPGSEPSLTYGKRVVGADSSGREIAGRSMGEDTKGNVRIMPDSGFSPQNVPAGQVRLAEGETPGREPISRRSPTQQQNRSDHIAQAERQQAADRGEPMPPVYTGETPAAPAANRQLPTEQSPMPRRADDPGGAPASRALTNRLHADIGATLDAAPKTKPGNTLPEGHAFEAGSPHQVLHNDHGPRIVDSNMKQAQRVAGNRNALLADTAQHLDRMAAKPGVDEKSASRLREHAATARQLAGISEPDATPNVPDTAPAAPADRTGQWVETPHGTGQVTSSYTDPEGDTFHTVRFSGGKGQQSTKQMVNENDIRPLGITTDPGSDTASRVNYDHLREPRFAPAAPGAVTKSARDVQKGDVIAHPHTGEPITVSQNVPRRASNGSSMYQAISGTTNDGTPTAIPAVGRNEEIKMHPSAAAPDASSGGVAPASNDPAEIDQLAADGSSNAMNAGFDADTPEGESANAVYEAITGTEGSAADKVRAGVERAQQLRQDNPGGDEGSRHVLASVLHADAPAAADLIGGGGASSSPNDISAPDVGTPDMHDAAEENQVRGDGEWEVTGDQTMQGYADGGSAIINKNPDGSYTATITAVGPDGEQTSVATQNYPADYSWHDAISSANSDIGAEWERADAAGWPSPAGESGATPSPDAGDGLDKYGAPADRFREPAVDPNAPATGLEAKYGTPGPGGRPTGELSGPKPSPADLPAGQPVVFRDDQGQVRMGRVSNARSNGAQIRDTEGTNHNVPFNNVRRVTMGDYERDSGLSPDEIAGGSPDASPAERDPVEWDALATKPWSQIHNDFKSTDANGNRSVLARTRRGATTSVPWRGPGPDSGTSGAADEVTPADPAAEAQALRDRVNSPSGRSAKMQRAFRAAQEGDHRWLNDHGFTHTESPSWRVSGINSPSGDLESNAIIKVDDDNGLIGVQRPGSNVTSWHKVNGNGQAAPYSGPVASKVVHDPGASGVPSDVGGQAEVDQLRDRVSMARTGRSAKMQRAFTAAEQGDHAWLAQHGFDVHPEDTIHAHDGTGFLGFGKPDGSYSVQQVNGNGSAGKQGMKVDPSVGELPPGFRQVGTPEGNGPLTSDRNATGGSRAARNAARSGQAVNPSNDYDAMRGIANITPEKRAAMSKAVADSNTSRSEAAQRDFPEGTRVAYGAGQALDDPPHVGVVTGHTPQGMLKLRDEKTGRDLPSSGFQNASQVRKLDGGAPAANSPTGETTHLTPKQQQLLAMMDQPGTVNDIPIRADGHEVADSAIQDAGIKVKDGMNNMYDDPDRPGTKRLSVGSQIGYDDNGYRSQWRLGVNDSGQPAAQHLESKAVGNGTYTQDAERAAEIAHKAMEQHLRDIGFNITNGEVRAPESGPKA